MKKYLLSSTNLLSPSFAGISGGAGIAVGLLFHAALPIGYYTAPLWAWLVALVVIPGIGFILQIAVRRVIYIKLFFAAVLAGAAFVYGHLVWLVLAAGADFILRLVIAALILMLLICVSIQACVSILRSPERSTMPHEEFGVLDSVSGLIDPSQTLPRAQGWRRRWDKMAIITRSLLPLVAGLSMLLVRSLSASGEIILLVFCASVMAVGVAAGAGRHLGFAAASWRWEGQHDIAITVG